MTLSNGGSKFLFEIFGPQSKLGDILKSKRGFNNCLDIVLYHYLYKIKKSNYPYRNMKGWEEGNYSLNLKILAEPLGTFLDLEVN